MYKIRTEKSLRIFYANIIHKFLSLVSKNTNEGRKINYIFIKNEEITPIRAEDRFTGTFHEMKSQNL